MNKKETRGGKRQGAGRKKSGTETKTISFRVDVRHVEAVSELVKSKIAELKAITKK